MQRNYLNYNMVAILVADTLDIDESDVGASIVNTALAYDRYVELNPQGELIGNPVQLNMGGTPKPQNPVK